MAKPKLRFPQFSEDWEQRKLGQMGSLKNGMNFSKDSLGKGFPFVNLQDIFGRSEIDAKQLGRALASLKQLQEYNLLAGDVLFVRSSVKLEGVGEAAVVPEDLKDTTFSGFIIRFRDESGISKKFKQFMFAIDPVRRQILSQATNSANKNINQSILSKLVVRLPCHEEQEKIGDLFRHIDTAITLHQRNQNAHQLWLEKFKLRKKGNALPGLDLGFQVLE